MIETAFIFAAGKGERLRPLTDQTPKPLLPVNGRPILDWILDEVAKVQSIRHLVFNAWYLKDQILSYAQQKQSSGWEIDVSVEDVLLGTGGGLKQARKFLGEKPFLLLNGDCLFRADLEGFLERCENRSEDAVWWLTNVDAKQTKIGVDANKQIGMIGSLYDRQDSTSYGCFTGIQFMRSVKWGRLPDQGCLVRDYFIPQLKAVYRLGAETGGLSFWSDLGTPERLAQGFGSDSF